MALREVTPPEYSQAVRFLTAAVALRPDSPGANLNLGNALKDKGQVDAAMACYQKAIQLDPKYATPHNNLGTALADKGKVEEAIACFRRAIDLDPKFAGAHHNLGRALVGKGQVDEAIACWRKAVELAPKYASAHANLGTALKDKGQVDGAIASLKKAIALDPKFAKAHVSLGAIFCDVKRDYDGAIAMFRKAIEIDHKDAQAHYNLGNALYDKGRVDEAIACYRKAIEVDAKFAEVHCNLGHAFRNQGRFAESLAALQRGDELGSKRPGWPYPSAEWVRQAKRLAALEGKLPAFLKGERKLTDTAERVGLAGVCQAKKLHHAATRLYADAFAADAKLVEEDTTGLRYKAACQAALAGAGKGEDAGKLDDQERARLRKQALDWLRADLALLAAGEVGRRRVARILGHWQQDGELASLRDATALQKLPAEERAAFRQLWADVAVLLKKAQEKPK
jgi:tetratricopeptide (TPR) repeat protein